MRSFLLDSACNGSRPKVPGPTKHFSRPRLMTCLMAERGVARFLVAPAGYGKSMLALEYAESIFEFRNVYWVRCQSPCFLRDLDGGVISLTLQGAGSQGCLAVFEDVPYLDDERARAFAEDIDALLSSGWEVLVSTTPACDVLADMLPNRVVMGSQDFLVDDVELTATGCNSLRGVTQADRVASFVWGGEEAAIHFLDGMKLGETSLEIQLAVFVMLVMQEGTVDDVLSFAHGLKKEARAFVEGFYPHAGLDLINECFQARDLSVAQLKRAFGDSFEAMARCASSTAGRDAFACRLADALVAKGRLRRAAQVAELFCSRRKRMQWMESVQDAYFSAGQVLSMQRLFESLGEHPSGLTPGLLVGAARRLLALGQEAPAAKLSLRALGASSSGEALMCRAALLHLSCPCSAQGAKALAMLKSVLRIWDAEGESCQEPVLRALAASRLGLAENPGAALDALEGMLPAMALEPAAMEHAAFLVSHVDAWGGEGDQNAWSARDVRRLSDAVPLALAEAQAARFEPSLEDALLRDAFLARAGRGSSVTDWDAQCDALVLSLEKQRREYADYGRTRPLAPAKGLSQDRVVSEKVHEMVPEMYVRLFGGMEVRIGSRVLDPRAFAKQKAKTLLAVLVLHKGKEVPRHELMDIMWPEASGRRAANNYYSLWSILKKALGNEEGECPYLVKQQTSCMVDARYVRSDVEEFETLCRRLFFEPPSPSAWLEVFGRLQDEFSSCLLPSETDNAFIIASRERFRQRLSDAYVSAAMRLCDAGESQVALWFAKAAFEQGKVREDAYFALMRAQMLSGQRTLAMETFHMCRDYLREELGIDPSGRMADLYLQLINSQQSDMPL